MMALASEQNGASPPSVALGRTFGERFTWKGWTLAVFAIVAIGSAAFAGWSVWRSTKSVQWLSLLDDKDPSVRRTAAMYFNELGIKTPDRLPRLVDALDDTDAGVRRQVVFAIAKFGPTAAAALPALVRALEDEDSFVRAHAASAIGSLNRDNATPAIPIMMNVWKTDKDSTVRRAAGEALDRLGVQH